MISITATVKVREGRFKRIARQIEAAFLEESTEIKRLEEQTVATWSSAPPFSARPADSGGTKRAYIGPTGDGARIWNYLNRGTSIRYATMTPDFVPKTRVRNLRSGRGRGGVAYISRNRPRPGIKAREWTKVIKEERAPRFKRRIQQALRSR